MSICRMMCKQPTTCFSLANYSLIRINFKTTKVIILLVTSTIYNTRGRRLSHRCLIGVPLHATNIAAVEG